MIAFICHTSLIFTLAFFLKWTIFYFFKFLDLILINSNITVWVVLSFKRMHRQSRVILSIYSDKFITSFIFVRVKWLFRFGFRFCVILFLLELIFGFYKTIQVCLLYFTNLSFAFLRKRRWINHFIHWWWIYERIILHVFRFCLTHDLIFRFFNHLRLIISHYLILRFITKFILNRFIILQILSFSFMFVFRIII